MSNDEKKQVRNSETDYDAFWKIFIEDDFEDFMAFSFRKLHTAIDYNKPIELLPKTLHKIMVEYGKKGTNTTDLLIKVFLKPEYTASGEPEEVWLLIHIEIEISPKGDFSFRMFSYFYRALDKYGKKVVALAVFPGEKPQPHHKYFLWEKFGTKVRYEFSCLDAHAWKDETLLKKKSIVALALLACKRAVRTRGKYNMRYTYKREMLDLIKKRNYPLEKAKRLINFVFYVMYLPKDLDRKITNHIYEQYNEDMSTTKMPLAAQQKAHELFEYLIEKSTGKSYAQFIKDQKNEVENFKRQIAEEKKRAAEEKLYLEQKAAEERKKSEEEKLYLEQKAAEERKKSEEEKLYLEQKAAEEKQYLEQKAAEDKKKLVYELSKLLSIENIAIATKMKEEEIRKILEEDEKTPPEKTV